MIKYLISIICIFLISGCVVKGTWLDDGKTLKLEGWGAKGATWEVDGNKYSISKGEPFKVPDILPAR